MYSSVITVRTAGYTYSILCFADGVKTQPVVFFVARNADQLIRQDPVQFQIEYSDRFDDFDLSNSFFTAPTSGAYFFTMSAGIIEGRRTDFLLESSYPYVQTVGIVRDANNHNGDDIASRDVIMYLNPNDDFYVLSQGGLASSSNGLETSFGGFSLHDILRNPYTAFSVARETDYSLFGSPIIFNVENVNEGRFFNLNDGTFTVPVTGLYFFSFSVGVRANEAVSVQLSVDGVVRAEILRAHSNYAGIDTISR